jgi:hypothetical protein
VTLRRSLLVLALLAAACGRKIGDSCKTSADCSLEAERNCDISQPSGYCTIEGCDERSCPGESACIRFFPRLFLTKRCDANSPCSTDELCLAEGLCAPRSSERRYCALKCGDNGDCRDHYECRQAGQEGSLALTSDPSKQIKFCAPAAQ